MLSAPNPKPQRLAAIEALGRAGDAAVVAPLLVAAADEDPGIADTARAAVATLPGEAVDREIVARLQGADAKILPVLVELVGRRRIAAVAALLPLASHPDERVRTATIVALGPTVDLANLDVLVVADESDSPHQLAALLDQAEARSVASLLKPHVSGLRSVVRDAVMLSVTRAHERLTPDSLARLMAVSRRLLSKRLEGAQLPPPHQRPPGPM